MTSDDRNADLSGVPGSWALDALPYFVWVHWDEVIPILDDGSGPTETVGDYAEVWARNKREAKWAGYRAMEANPPKERWMHGWPEVQRADGLHPLRGMKASLAVCPHGLCLLGEDRDESVDCAECAEEWRIEEQRTLQESEGTAQVA